MNRKILTTLKFKFRSLLNSPLLSSPLTFPITLFVISLMIKEHYLINARFQYPFIKSYFPFFNEISFPCSNSTNSQIQEKILVTADFIFKYSIFWIGLILVKRKVLNDKILIPLCIISLPVDLFRISNYFNCVSNIWLEKTSAILIVIFAITFIMRLTSRFKNLLTKFKNLLQIFQINFFSLLFIGIITIGLTIIPQSTSLVVELVKDPRNFALFFVSLSIASISISTKPAYFEELIRVMPAKSWEKFAIFFFYEKDGIEKDKTSFYSQQLRHYLGGVIYVAAIYIVIKTFTFIYYPNYNNIPIIICLCFSISNILLQKHYLKIITIQTNYCARFRLYIIGLAIQIALCICPFFCNLSGTNLSRNSFLIPILLLILGNFSFIYFRAFRSSFDQLNINPKKLNPINVTFKPLAKNRNLVISIFASGLIFFFVTGYLTMQRPKIISSITVLIVGLTTYYGLITSVVKINLYHNSAANSKNYKKLPIRPIFLTVFFIYLMTSSLRPNPNYTLNTLEYSSTVPSISDFKSEFLSHSQNSDSTYFAVNSFGGGLKSNFWTMSVLNKIDSLSGSMFTNQTVVHSGVSGGSLGIANYFHLFNSNRNYKEKDLIIDKIGQLNLLTPNLSGLLFSDPLESIVSSILSIKFQNRSERSMSLYIDCLELDESVLVSPFYDHYLNIKKTKYYPNIIFNSTSSKGAVGVASYVNVSFAGAVNILNPDSGRTISFFDAASTSNRFPFLNPPAVIPNLGTFIDGGYFDNSGILMMDEFVEYLSDSIRYNNHPVYTIAEKEIESISVVNSKELYVKHILRQYLGTNDHVKKGLEAKSNVSAIINSLFDISVLPNYLLEKKSRNPSNSVIYLPYIIDNNSLINIFGDVIPDSFVFNFLNSNLVIENNDQIKSALKAYGYDIAKWGLIEPSLCRSFSYQDLMYQKAIVNQHAPLQNTFNEIIDKLKKK